ncbi:GNAT family N-acetyltransferase [Streptomyces sp. NBC_00691]|uniref:GNAT family N-acetyltransferase n=1 Tax=Streptomyces sp. NBC_00691 TaxID=2903671 RepID=UPI002E33B2AF|nr:GNAT family N-acetyltransferase [Streptomyces sp. NBC_00691]
MNPTDLIEAPATPTAPALLLRPWHVDDVAELVEAYRDPALGRWAISAIGTEDDGLAWVRAQEQARATGGRLGFAVVEAPFGAEPRRLAGGVVLKEVAPGRPSAEVGYWTVARARGRGVAPRALAALTAWAFDTFRADGLERLELLHQSDNEASCRVAEKCGYPFARILPATPPAFPLDGHLHVRGPS